MSVVSARINYPLPLPLPLPNVGGFGAGSELNQQKSSPTADSNGKYEAVVRVRATTVCN
jgi:hypothetical protein